MLFESILFDLDDTLHNSNKTLNNFVDLFKLKYSCKTQGRNVSRVARQDPMEIQTEYKWIDRILE